METIVHRILRELVVEVTSGDLDPVILLQTIKAAEDEIEAYITEECL